MTYYVIAGKPDCPHLAHVAYVCCYLQQNLPSFKYTKIQLKTQDWQEWLAEKNTFYGWHHTKSPIIWKELEKRGGKPYLIGGISEFWEYCYDYYGLQSILPKEDLEKLVEDNMQYMEMLEKQEQAEKKIRYVCICGIENTMVNILIPELLKDKNLPLADGLVIRLFNSNTDFFDNLEYVVDLMKDASDMTSDVVLVESYQQALDNCDLFILIEDCSRQETDMQGWLIHNMSSMHMLADEINSYAKKTLRIIFACHGPSCYNATILVENCTKIRLANIVAVTGDVGLSALKIVAEEADVPLHNLSAPPVWGFGGVDPFIDIGSIIIKCDIYRPYLRAIRTNGGSTLPLGTIRSELRHAEYITHDIEGVCDKIDDVRLVVSKALNRSTCYSKVSATMKVLNIWYSGRSSDEIISLGICSNGSFGFPPGMVVSQPAIFDGKHWVPFQNFPMTNFTKEEVEKCVPRMLKIVEMFNVKKEGRRTSIFYV